MERQRGGGNFAFLSRSFFNSGYGKMVHTYRGVARSKTVGWTEGASMTHGERGARAYNGCLGAEPPAGSRGRAPSQGSGGRPLKLKAFCRWTTHTRGKVCHFSLVFLKPPLSQK